MAALAVPVRVGQLVGRRQEQEAELCTEGVVLIANSAADLELRRPVDLASRSNECCDSAALLLLVLLKTGLGDLGPVRLLLGPACGEFLPIGTHLARNHLVVGILGRLARVLDLPGPTLLGFQWGQGRGCAGRGLGCRSRGGRAGLKFGGNGRRRPRCLPCCGRGGGCLIGSRYRPRRRGRRDRCRGRWRFWGRRLVCHFSGCWCGGWCHDGAASAVLTPDTAIAATTATVPSARAVRLDRYLERQSAPLPLDQDRRRDPQVPRRLPRQNQPNDYHNKAIIKRLNF
ncbi:hypothetical protein RR21198_2351 [Rhodococcus rhodochrous ATCC 21198]|nr:hypothetical protein RR21198_2351 [Rhodococcus rhodochrous ATCC 21198]